MKPDPDRGRINARRVVLGGLVAGIVYNAGGIVSASLMNLQGALTRLGWEPTVLTGLLHLGMRFGFGFLSVFLYAAIRPRFGPGLRTALIVGVLVWCSVYVPLIIMMAELQVFTSVQSVLGAAWGLVEACVGTWIGAWLYREAATPSQAVAGEAVGD